MAKVSMTSNAIAGTTECFYLLKCVVLNIAIKSTYVVLASVPHYSVVLIPPPVRLHSGTRSIHCAALVPGIVVININIV